jgi:1-deoxyxylulose-5-phosphate synthase
VPGTNLGTVHSRSRIILGCGNFGGIGSAPPFFGQGESEEEAFRIMDAAWAGGIRWFDTADAYGGGRSEMAIGKWIAATGNRPRLTTKTFNPMDEGANSGLSRERILRQLDSSLERLHVERVDLYLAHEFDPDTPLGETIETFEELVAAGKIGAYGISNFDARQLAEAIETGRPAVLQNSYSLLERADEQDVIPFCARSGVAYQAFSPLAGGWLTGKYRRGESYPPGSRMTMRPEPYEELESEGVFRGLDGLRAAAAGHAVELATLALAWLLSSPDVSAVVLGPRRPEQLDPAFGALELELSPGNRDALASLFP